MKSNLVLLLLSFIKFVKYSFQGCCTDCTNTLANTELPTPVILYQEPVYTTPDKHLMCSQKFTVEDGICCEQTSLEQHWLEFKAREEAKILPIKQIFANTRIRYFSEIAQTWLQTNVVDPHEPTKTRLQKFFGFAYNYPPGTPMAGAGGATNTYLFDEEYINNKLES
jgi:hypothetical protein